VSSMANGKLSWRAFAYLAVISSMAFGLGLGSSARLTYHEAFVAQGAREMLRSGNWGHPTIGGLAWLEKPPLPFWLVAGLGWCAGEVSPLIARLPSAIAAGVLVLGVGVLASRRYGSRVGMLAGAIQGTTAWTVFRGRLAEADILLACLLVWTLLAFDRIRVPGGAGGEDYRTGAGRPRWQSWRWVFFTLLSVTALVKGTGFGAVLGLVVIALVIGWDRDSATRRRLLFPAGWILVMVVGLGWPLAMIAEHGCKVMNLWAMHVSERVVGRTGHGTFAGEPWREYALSVLGEGLPWTPLALVGACRSLGRAWCGYHRGYNGQVFDSLGMNQVAGDRLLCSWALAPLVLVSLPSARNAHYAIYALVPWSVWAALGVVQLGSWQVSRGWLPVRLRWMTWGTFSSLALAYGLSFWLAGPWFDRRGIEWAFYETTGHTLPSTTSLVLLYDDWDRDPYPTPFGPIPHDLAVRLFYLNRPACWHYAASVLAGHGMAKCPLDNPHDSGASMMIIGRDHDLPALKELGHVEVLSRSPAVRWDRMYVLAKVQPSGEMVTSAAMQSSLRSSSGR